MSDIQYLLDGTDLENFARTIATLTSDLPIIGADDQVPYRPGGVFRRRTAGIGDVQLGLVIGGEDGSGGDTVQQFLTNWKTLTSLVWNLDATHTLTRNRTLASGVEASSAQATLNALPQQTMQGAKACTTVLDFSLLDGYFYGTTDVTISSPGTVTVQGDARTARMTVTMAAGTLTNTTTGAILVYSGSGTATIDVLNWTATSGGFDVSSELSWPQAGHDYWFDLAPGSNVLTGTASIAYRPAYLP